MDEVVSYCGLLCQGCPIYLATIETDKIKKDKMIMDIIDMCKKHYGIEYKYEDITDCDGCKSDSGRLFFGCKNCRIRECVIDKGFVNCAYCEEYACDQLQEIFETEVNARKRLDEIRSSL